LPQIHGLQCNDKASPRICRLVLADSALARFPQRPHLRKIAR
jgi:hypothetical protein